MVLLLKEVIRRSSSNKRCWRRHCQTTVKRKYQLTGAAVVLRLSIDTAAGSSLAGKAAGPLWLRHRYTMVGVSANCRHRHESGLARRRLAARAGVHRRTTLAISQYLQYHLCYTPASICIYDDDLYFAGYSCCRGRPCMSAIVTSGWRVLSH